MSDQSAGFFAGSVPEGYRRFLQPAIFEPWAQRLIAIVGLSREQTVLDVAAGTGVVARAAATVVGSSGRVIASDISAGMLAHVSTDADPDGAAIETLECSATELALPDASVDVVLCQQGFPFIPDRTAAAREMRRVLRPGGRVGVAVWLSDARLEPFDTYGDVLRAEGVEEPFPHAFDSSGLKMSTSAVEAALTAAGFSEVRVTTEELVPQWASVDAAAMGISGTPYGPPAAALDSERQRRLMATLRLAMTGADGTPARHAQTAVIGSGVAPGATAASE